MFELQTQFSRFFRNRIELNFRFKILDWTRSEKYFSRPTLISTKGQQRLKSFGIVERESERKRFCEDAPDQETANEVLNVSESNLGNDIEVLNVNLGHYYTQHL